MNPNNDKIEKIPKFFKNINFLSKYVVTNQYINFLHDRFVDY